ncbi:MAG: hypothetical protein LBH04_02470 [Tannerellaceae bacterium]|jgi:hypothetical protein|nr:hypothetical protein [Tannerellaceae bacterium]
MIRKKIITEDDKIVIRLPKEYIGKELEILIFSKGEIADTDLKKDETEARIEYACKLNLRDCMQPDRPCSGLTILNPYI